jgi:hypothetical protein
MVVVDMMVLVVRDAVTPQPVMVRYASVEQPVVSSRLWRLKGAKLALEDPWVVVVTEQKTLT